MSVLSSTQKRRRRIPNKLKFKSMGVHDEFLKRINKTLYYGKIPLTERFSLPVTELAAELYSNVKTEHGLERLCIEQTADVSRNACASPCSLILALFYLERLKTCNPDYIDRVSPSELFLVSLMVASKFLHDDGEEDEVFNTEWANSAGIEVCEVNRYEKNFLEAIKWDVFVNESEFWAGLSKIEKEVARREARRRGWFSYTELNMLLDLINAWSVAQTLVMVSVVCLTSYTASVLTLVGSAFISVHITSSIIPASSSLQMNVPAPAVPFAYDLSNSIDSVISADSSVEADDSNFTCFKSYSDLKDWNPCTKESSQNTEKSIVPNLLSLTSTLYNKMAVSIDNFSNELYYGSFMKNDAEVSATKFNETRSGLIEVIKMIITTVANRKANPYSVIDFLMKNMGVSSDMMTSNEGGSKTHVNQLSYFLRTLKLPS